MAKNIKDEAEGAAGTTKSHNIADINKAIVNGLDEIHKIDGQIDHLMETHIQPLKEARKKKFRDIKSDTDVSIGALKAHYKLMTMYRDADKFMEEDDAEKLRDDLKIVFDALHQGGQLDWVDVANAAEQSEAA